MSVHVPSKKAQKKEPEAPGSFVTAVNGGGGYASAASVISAHEYWLMYSPA